jgi:hypothetical protein
MNKILALVLLGLCLTIAMADSNSTGSNTFSTPVATPQGKTHPTLFDVWPAVDSLLKTQYWYYLRGSNPLYEASIDSPAQYLFFTIYRNIVGTFLVSTSWDKTTQSTQVNAFVRLGNGYNSQIYDPVHIDPFVVSIALKSDEYMVTVNPDGTISVTGNLALYNLENGQATFNVTADMNKKAIEVDKFNRDQYWYYLEGSQLIAESSICTNDQYYYVFIYVNPIGTFLSLSHFNLKDKSSGINTLVRLGDGIQLGNNFGPVNLSPSVLQLQTLN